MSTDYSVHGINKDEVTKKKNATTTIAYLRENNIDVPQELYDIIKRENIKLHYWKGPSDYTYEYRVKVSDIPKDVDTIVFQISR